MSIRRPSARPRARSAPPRAAGVRIEHGALRVGDREVPLLCGAVHYWRTPRASWEAALAETHRLGLPIVETYVPWQVHERAPGDHDFGAHDPQKDLGAFLDLAHAQGLLAFVRPGPHINSEMTWFGLPERIVYDPAMQARSPRQNPVVLGFPPRMFPVPSYASEAFHREAGRWLDAVGEVVGPRMWPHGNVVLLQVDNEATYWFRDAAYDQDYHPDALAQWKAWLERRYETIEACAHAHRTAYATWEDAKAPERFDAEHADQLARHMDWAVFREALIEGALVRFRDRMAASGMKGVPTVHNLPLGEQGAPVSTPALESVVDIVGLDFYHARREHRTIKRRSLYLAGTSRTPFAPEMGVGAPPWFTPLTHDDSLFCAMVCAAYGLRGMSLYMAVDRDRWYGAPIDAEGNPRIESGAWRAFLHALTRTGFHRLERKAPVGLVVPREYARLSRATHLLGVFSPLTLEAIGGSPVDACREDTLGFAGPIQVLWWKMLARFAEALTHAGIPYVYVDGDLPAERLASFQVLITPSYEFVDGPRWRALCGLAATGTTIVYGPAMPSLDGSMQPGLFEVPRHGERVFIDTLDDAVDVVTELARRLALPTPFAARPAPVETAAHENGDGTQVLFVIHPGTEPVEAEIDLPCAMTFEDAATGEHVSGEKTLRLTMAPLQCRMLIVVRSAGEHDTAAGLGGVS